MITADHKVLDEEQESRLHHKICSGCARLGDTMDSKLSLQNQISSGNSKKSETFLMSRRKPKVHLYGQTSGVCPNLRRAELELWKIYAAQIRNKWNCRTGCTTSERRHFVFFAPVWIARKLVGTSNGVSRADHPYWCRSKILSYICKRSTSSASVQRKSLSWNIHGIRLERGRRSWTGDPLKKWILKIWNSCKKIQIKRSGRWKKREWICYSLAGLATCCQNDSRHSPLCTKRVATSGKPPRSEPRTCTSTRFLEYYGR